MVRIVDARQPVIIVVVGDGLAFLGKVGCLLGQHIAECIIGGGGDAACRMVHLGAAVPHVIRRSSRCLRCRLHCAYIIIKFFSPY